MRFGRARFVGTHELVVQAEDGGQVSLRGKRFVIAVGTRPARPGHIPFTPQRKRRVDAALEMVQMEEYAERLPNQLSGGQPQRVALGRALVLGTGMFAYLRRRRG